MNGNLPTHAGSEIISIRSAEVGCIFTGPDMSSRIVNNFDLYLHKGYNRSGH
jgi:hypothetical protein